MSKALYFDCFSGISGDMTLGACVDAGVPLEYLKKEIKKLKLPGVGASRGEGFEAWDRGD